MPKQKNIDLATELKDKVSRAKGVIITDYRGLTHKQSEELHRAVKKADGEYIVAKNSLLKIATKDSNFSFEDADLKGTTAALFSYGDEFATLKELFKFAKTSSLPKVKLGFIAGQKYSDSQIEAMSKLPSVEVLQGQVVSRLSGPLYGLMYALNGNLQKLVYVLGNIKKEGG